MKYAYLLLNASLIFTLSYFPLIHAMHRSRPVKRTLTLRNSSDSESDSPKPQSRTPSLSPSPSTSPEHKKPALIIRADSEQRNMLAQALALLEYDQDEPPAPPEIVEIILEKPAQVNNVRI